MSFLTILPLAFVMVAGPQILSAVFLAMSENWRRNTAAFVVGALLSISLVVAVSYSVIDGAILPTSSNDTLYLIILVLLLGAMAHVYLTRADSKPPRWMGRLEMASPRFSFRLGFLLLGFFPTDILTSTAVGSHLVAQGEPLLNAVPFLLLTGLFLALPALILLAFGKRAETFLPEARDWMNANSWVVNEVVIVFFIALTIDSLVG